MDHEEIVDLVKRRETELSHVVESALARNRIPGISWGVVVGESLVVAQAQGLAQVSSSRLVRQDTVFRIASMTKSFTAAATLCARDDGLLRLDDPITHWLEELGDPRFGVKDARPVTIGMLLSMAAGFVNDDPWADRQLAISARAFLELLPLLDHEPGSRFEYSNFGYGLLGQIVARATGLPLRTFVGERFLDPLGMTSTTWDCDAVSDEFRAVGHRLEHGRYVEEPSLGDGALGAMGGLGTTVKDLARWVSFHMDAWPSREDPDPGPLCRASRREMATIHTVDNKGGYGFGLRIIDDPRDGLVVGHSGGLPGFGSRMEWRADLGVGVIVLANRTYAPMDSLAREIFRILDFEPPRQGVREESMEVEHFIDQIGEFYDRGDRVDELFADTYSLDLDDARHAPDFGALKEECGALMAIEEKVIIGRLRAKFVLVAERGRICCEVLLVPVAPARIQWISANVSKAS